MNGRQHVSVFEEIKQRQRKMWSTGSYPEIAKTIESVAQVVVDQTGVGEGDEHLDVATGSGNAALAGARKGAKVTGLDLVPELIEAARGRAQDEGLQITWVEGDAEDLPFEDSSFDRVTSVFGVMFAPQQEQAAAELVRVARAGARIGVAAWTPEGLNGQLFKTLGSHMPPPPPELKPPVLWGVESHVSELFSKMGARGECERRTVPVQGDSIDAWIDYCEEVLGPVVMAKAVLEPQGKWEAARADLTELFERFNEADDGTLRAPAEYLLTVADVPA
jgi:ubiquinone/menaquinone biosynthesis C-methylase UbiE